MIWEWDVSVVCGHWRRARRRVVLDTVLYLSGAFGAGESSDEVKGHVDACRDAGGGDDLPIVNPALVRAWRDGRVEGEEFLERCVVGGGGASAQEPCGGKYQGAGADTAHQGTVLGGIL